MNKLFLFDCDETIWYSDSADYISSIPSTFERGSAGQEIIRVADSTIFYLRDGIKEILEEINKSDDSVGIVSDNKPEPVLEALNLLELMEFIDQNAVNIKLWDGYCPKHIMVEEIISKSLFKDISRNNIYWFDDRDYSKEAKQIGVKFFKVNKTINMNLIIKKYSKN